MQIKNYARNRNMCIFRTFACFPDGRAQKSMQDISSQRDKAISDKKRCLTTKIRRKNNYVSRSHLQITETFQVFVYNDFEVKRSKPLLMSFCYIILVKHFARYHLLVIHLIGIF